MALLQLVYAPDPIFAQEAAPIEAVTDEIRQLADDMLETLAHEKAVGIGANMVGELKQIAVVDLCEDGVSKPYVFINPEITWRSDEMAENEEASLCFVAISAVVQRPKAIKLRYLDYDGAPQELAADGFLACVIQHEIDYLHGVTFLDHLSKMKREMLLKKMRKYIKAHPPHVHGPGCSH